MVHPNPKFRHGGGEPPISDEERELWKMSPAMAIASRLMAHDHFASDTLRPGVDPGQKPGALGRALIDAADNKLKQAPAHDYGPEDRPLIDVVREASFRNDPGLYSISDHRAFRDLLGRARCFTLDAETSAMVGDLSVAVAHDLEASRQMALPPYPVTWFEIDNVARLARMRERGVPLTPTAAGATDAGPPVPRVGWLIYENTLEGGYCASYLTRLNEGVLISPLAFMWQIGDESYRGTGSFMDAHAIAAEHIERVAFGVRPHLCNARRGSYLINTPRFQKLLPAHALKYMDELTGELRHVFGLLVAVSAGHAGLTMSTSPKGKYGGPSPVLPSGKPLLPLEHHHLHLHLGKRRSVDHVVTQIITHHRKRFHEVRAHMRKLRSGRMVPVKSHGRGDAKLGTITKDYIVEK